MGTVWKYQVEFEFNRVHDQLLITLILDWLSIDRFQHTRRIEAWRYNLVIYEHLILNYLQKQNL